LDNSRDQRSQRFDNGAATTGAAPPLPLRMVMESARVAAMQSYITPSAPPTEPFITIVRITANLVRVPVAMISLIDRNDQWIKAAFGTNLQQLPRAFAICNHVMVEPSGALVVEDTLADARFQSHPLVLGPPHVRFYAGVCLIDSDGYALGTLCVMDDKPGSMGPDALALLRKMAVEAVDALVRQRAGLGAWQDSPGSVDHSTDHSVDQQPDERWPKDAPSRRASDRSDSGPGMSPNFEPPPRVSAHGWLGVRTEYSPVPGEDHEGRLLTSVAVNSPAERAGLRVGDIILAIDGRDIRRRNDITLAIRSCALGRAMRLHVWRDSEVFDQRIRLEPMPKQRHLPGLAS